MALDSIITMRDPKGNPTKDITNAYVTLDIWLKDAEGKQLPYLSCGAILRLGVFASKLLWEKSMFKIYTDGEGKFNVRKILGEAIGPGGAMVSLFNGSYFSNFAVYLAIPVILLSMVFCVIQYAMCSIEFSIVQAIGAVFIPFFLFDGTKEIPKKLVPVFIAFFIKIIVMTVCLIFVLYLWVDFAVEQISPDSGGFGMVGLAEVLFTSVLSFVLTSNAPKIASTILTGQPQLSMGEFMQAAGTMMAGATAAKNVAMTVAAPAAEAAKTAAANYAEQQAAGNLAAEKAGDQYIDNKKSEVTNGIDTSTPEGKKEADEKWSNYQTEHADDLAEGKKKAEDIAKAKAISEVADFQNLDYQRHGGAAGAVGRMLAHYTGAAASPVLTMKSGKRYQGYSPERHDLNRIAGDTVNKLNSEGGLNFADNRSSKTSHGDKKNSIEERMTKSTRQSGLT